MRDLASGGTCGNYLGRIVAKKPVDCGDAANEVLGHGVPGLDGGLSVRINGPENPLRTIPKSRDAEYLLGALYCVKGLKGLPGLDVICLRLTRSRFGVKG